MPTDAISLRNLHMTAVIGPDAWNRPGKPQPIVLTLKLMIDTTPAGTSDEIAHTFSYGQMYKDVTALSDRHFHSIDEITSTLVNIAGSREWPGESLQISLFAPKALLRVEDGLGREVTLQKQQIESGAAKKQIWGAMMHSWLIKKLQVACIIGVNPHERLEKQHVMINLKILAEQGMEEEFYGNQNQGQKILWATLVSRICNVSRDSCCFSHLFFCYRLITCMSR